MNVVGIIDVIEVVCLVILVLATGPCLYRIAVGPHALDRLLAFDLTGILVATILALFALVQDNWVYLETALGLAVLAFVGTVAVGFYVERHRET